MARVVLQERPRARSGSKARAGVASALALALAAAAPATAAARADRGEAIPEHAAWTELLQRFVSSGLVDYASWKREGEPALEAYLRALESDRSALGSRPRSDQMAFWIDAYNAYTVKLVLEHYPLRSIRSIGLLPGAAFRRRFIPLGEGGAKLSLDDVEHRILRERFGDPRIHFAVVCASRSCPALRPEAYRGRELDAQLDDAAEAFLRDPVRNRHEEASRTLSLSSIFEWFRGDFEAAAGSLSAFVARYAEAPVAEALRRGDVKIEFLPYDWSLNER